MPKKGRNIYKRKDGRWEGRLLCTDTHKYIYVYGKTYTQAKEKLEAVRLDRKQADTGGSLLFTSVLDRWLSAKKSSVSISSYYCYKSRLDRHIMPYFKGMSYNSVTAATVADFINLKKSEGLSTKYIADMVTVIKAAASLYSAETGCINRIASVENVKIRRSEPLLLSLSEQKTLQACLLDMDSCTSIGIYLCMFTGLRIGELCALTWKDIDLDEGLIHINKTAQRIGSLGSVSVMLTSAKTQSSERIIPLPPFVAEKLARFKTDDSCFLLSGTQKLIEPRCLSYRFKSILKKADLPSVKFHSLRHTFATNCLKQSFDIKTLSEILGHSCASITMRVYLHSSMERKTECMRLLKPMV